MKISKKMARMMTVLMAVLTILFAAGTMLNGVYASGYTIPSAVVMLIVLAIKYISAAPNDKAEIKKHAVVYIVGAIVLFAASALLGILKNFTTGITA